MVEAAQNPSNSFSFPFIQNGASTGSPAKGAFEQKAVSELPPVPLLVTRNASKTVSNPPSQQTFSVESVASHNNIITPEAVSTCSEVAASVGRKKKPVGGIQFDEKSQISAQTMLCMIKENKKLTPWMKDFFVVQGDSLALNPARVKKIKDGVYSISMKAGEPKVSEIPQWFQNALEAIGSKKWQFTTSLALTSTDATSRFVPDSLIMPSLPEDKKYIGFGFTNPEHTTQFLHLDGEFTQPNVVSVVNRFKYSLTEGQEVKNTNAQMVETFFHELAAHAALAQVNLDADHASDDYRLGFAPMSQADSIAKDVAVFFGHIDEAGRFTEEGRMAGYQAERANVSGLIKSVGVIGDLENVPELDKNKINKAIEGMERIGNLND